MMGGMLRLAIGIGFLIAVVVAAVIAILYALGIGRFDHSVHAPKPPSLEQQCMDARGDWVYANDGSGDAGCQFSRRVPVPATS